MLDAYLAGDVPHGVFADWCEEHGIVFPRKQTVLHRMRNNGYPPTRYAAMSCEYPHSWSSSASTTAPFDGLASASGSRAGAYRESVSGSSRNSLE